MIPSVIGNKIRENLVMEQKNDRQKWLRMTARVGAILFGNAIYAMAVVLFIMPNGLVTGGTAGMGLFFNRH